MRGKGNDGGKQGVREEKVQRVREVVEWIYSSKGNTWWKEWCKWSGVQDGSKKGWNGAWREEGVEGGLMHVGIKRSSSSSRRFN